MAGLNASSTSVLLSAGTDSDLSISFFFLGMLVYEKFCEVLSNNARVRGILTSPTSCPKKVSTQSLTNLRQS